jgi:hypothetical protein
MASTFEELKLNSIDSSLNTAPQLLENSLAIALPTKKSITGFTSVAAINNNLLDGTGAGLPTDVTNYNSGILYIVSTATSGNYTVQSSYDSAFSIGSSKNLQMREIDVPSANPIGSAVIITASTRAFELNLQCLNYIRVNLATATAGVTAYLVLSQLPNTSIYTNVQQAIAGNLNANVGNLNAILNNSGTNDVASSAITASVTSASFTVTGGLSYSSTCTVSAVSGVNAALQIDIQESSDTGNTWYTVYSFAPITAAGTYVNPKIPYLGNRIRYVQTITGTTPSFTRNINRLSYNDIPSTPVRVYRTGGIETNDVPLYGRVLEIAVNNMTSNVIYLQIFNKASALATNDIPIKIYPINANSSLVMGAEVFGDYGLYYGATIRAGLSSTFTAYTAISSLTGTSLIIDYH